MNETRGSLPSRVLLYALIPLIVSACSSPKPRISTYTDTQTRTFSCVSPTLALNQIGIRFSLYEQESAKEKVSTRSCRKVSAAEQSVTKHGALGGLFGYAVVSVLTLGTYPLADAAGMLDEDKCGTQKVEDSGKDVTRQSHATGRFVGKILVVPVNFPEESKEQFFDGSIGQVTLPVSRSDSEYAVHIKGSYKSSNVQCDVDLQQVVGDASPGWEAGAFE